MSQNESPQPERKASRISRFCQWLFDEATPRFGQLSVWLLLLFAVIVSLLPFEADIGPRRAQPATIFAWMPSQILASPIFFLAARVLLCVSALLWAARKFLPYSCWMTVLAFTLMWSLRMENLSNGSHIFNVTNWLLIIHAMWFHFRHREIAASLARKDFFETRLYPRWVFWLCLFYLGWFHSLAGITKISTSGWGWGTGVSMQLWTELFGTKASPFAQVFLWDTGLTAILQTGALFVECLSIVCVLGGWFRYAIGLALIGFYFGVLTTFVDFGFHFNAILVAWFLLPVDRWLGLTFTPKA